MSDQPFARANPWATATAIFAGAILLTIGLIQLVQGITAVANSELLVVTPGYAFAFNLTTWGWIHIVLGLVAGAFGAGTLVAKSWGMIGGIVVAVLLVGVNFAWLPFQPFWAVVSIVINIACIWALSSVIASERSS